MAEYLTEHLAEHLADHLLLRYRQHLLTAEELLRLDEHLQSCEVCQTRLTASRQSAVGLFALNSDLSFATEHLTYEELAGYVDRTLQPAALTQADTHLRDCALCTAELDDLRAFSHELKPVALVPATTTQSSWRAWWNTLQWRWALPLATATTACLLIVILAQRSSVQSPPVAQQTATSSPVSPASPPGSATPQMTLNVHEQLAGFNELSAAQQKLLAAAISQGRVPVSENVGLSARRETLLGEKANEETFALLTPVGQIVLSNRPTLRWQPLKDAASYRVTIFSDDYEPVAESPALTVTSWTPPQALQRNRVYLWNVTARKGGQEIKAPVAPAPEARFKVLKQSLADEIAVAARPHTPAADLLLGLLYARAGLFDEADGALQKAARQNSSVVQPLLNDLRAQRRRAQR